MESTSLISNLNIYTSIYIYLVHLIMDDFEQKYPVEMDNAVTRRQVIK